MLVHISNSWPRLRRATFWSSSIVEILARDIEPDNWSLPYWTPALVRRAKLDRELREQMFSALVGASTVSLKVTLLSLLSHGMGLTDDLRQYATDERRKLQREDAPAIGFDLIGNAYRPLSHVLTELAA